ncbi:MAG: hypothetical protein HDR18_13115 [Lachnospiraceae bacterium]|nr:hypothetical protein [Lachnospiraceae bacterium]
MIKELLIRLSLLLGLFALAAVIINRYADRSPVVINEVCSSNFAASCNENGDYSDCIELYNSGETDFSLNGCFLTDNDNEPEKYALDGITIPAKSYTLIWLNQESAFRISKDGDQLFLIDSNCGAYLDQVIVPSLSCDTSYGRTKDGGSEWSVMSTTLGSANKDAEILSAISLDKPIFETTSGFYDEAFELRLYSPGGEKIYYTLDGSEPCADSLVYTKPIRIADNSPADNRYAAREDLAPSKRYTPESPVDKAVVVRAACYNPYTNRISDIVTETFFVGYQAKEEYGDMPVISLVADPEDLFDDQTGIYGNGAKYEEYLVSGGLKDGEVLNQYIDENGETHYRYMASNAFNKGREWERKATISYFDEKHSHLFTQNMGIRISGNSTRSAPQKSFNVFARDIYDDAETVSYHFFDNDITYSSVKLRNGGGNGEGIKFLDAFLEEAARGRDISIQDSKPCVVFLNGEYWGIYNIRERYNAEYLAAHYGLDPEGIMLIKAGNALTVPDETMTAYKYMLDVITECDLHYDDTYALACDLVDIQSLIDYCCINLYLDNRDVAFGYNTALWRTTQEGTSYSDGKWRYMLYDLDECIHPDSNTGEAGENWMREHPLLNEPAVVSLLDNENFRRQFCISFMDIANTTFSYERIHPMLAQWSRLYEQQIVKDHQRFYAPEYNLDSYCYDISQIDAFFDDRFQYAMESLAQTFQLEGELTRISISSNIPEGGTVTVNTAVLEEQSTWEGYYYSDFPVSVTVQPHEGYRFIGWQGDVSGTDDKLSVSLENGEVSLQALFEKDKSVD